MEITFIENGRKRKGIIKVCNICKKDFPSRLNIDKKFCSNKCRFLSRQNRIQIECAWCKKKFERSPSKIHELAFCTRKCKDTAQCLGGLIQLQLPHYGSGYSNYECLIDRTENPCCVGCNETRRYCLTTHHKDGNRQNNILENLEIVCANCHMKRHLKFIDGVWVYNTKALTPRELLSEL